MSDRPSYIFPVGAIEGFLIAYPIGSAIGVYLVGNIGDETGSFGATLRGSIIGGALGLLAFGVGVLPGAPIGATIGFNSSRRYKTPRTSETGLLNFRDGEVYLTIPTIYLKPYSFNDKTLVQNVSLIKVEF